MLVQFTLPSDLERRDQVVAQQHVLARGERAPRFHFRVARRPVLDPQMAHADGRVAGLLRRERTRLDRTHPAINVFARNASS